MIEASQTIITQPARGTREPVTAERADQAPFSLAFAATTLQSQAAVSLKVHGAAPSNNAAANGFAAQQTTDENHAPTAQNLAPPQNSDAQKAAADAAPARHPASETPQRAGSQDNTPLPAPAPQAAVQSAPATLALGAAPAASAVTSASPREGAHLREAAASKNTPQAPKPAQAAREPQTPQQDFATLIARRLDKATNFDIRLDPPELGRVEGRFTIGDDGKTVLALTFDNQTAFDLFAKDQAALRSALAGAGFDLANSDLAFSLSDERAGSPAFSALNGDPAAIALAASYDPVFNAPFSNGAIDIRI